MSQGPRSLPQPEREENSAGDGIISRLAGNNIWRDLLFIGAIGGVIYYAGGTKRQIDVNTGRIDTLERIVGSMSVIPQQILELQKQLDRHETATDQTLRELRQSDADVRRALQEYWQRDIGRSPGK